MDSTYTRLATKEVDEDVVELPWIQRPYISRIFDSRRERTNSHRPTGLRNHIGILKDLVLYSLAFWGLFSVLRTLAITNHLRADTASAIVVTGAKPLGCDCGDSVVEAISLGCKFDALSMAWLPEHCRDDELTAEFDTTGKGPNGTWIYYADTAHTTEVGVEEVAAMGDDPSKRVHMDKDWHQTHCLYYWLKTQRSKRNGKIIEPRSDTEMHIRHCGMVFREPGYGTISGVALNTNEVVEE